MSSGRDNDGPRQPRNMQSLLNFCTEITAREDPTGPTNLVELDPERRAFLEEALAGMTVNAVKKLAEAVKLLCNEAVTMPGEDITEQENAIEVMGEYVDDLNYAMDLHKMGGFPVVIRCLDSPHTTLRVGSASLIGDICQNYTYCQENMQSLNVIPTLLQMMDSDSDDQARVKALYALSCLIRDYPKGKAEFLEKDGFSYLMRAMQSGNKKLVIKSVFLLNNLVRENNLHKETLMSMGYVEQLTTILSNDQTDDICREHCMAALVGLASSHPPALEECLRPELQLPQLLRSRLSNIKGKEELQEEEEHIKELLRLFESGNDNGEEETCR